MKFPFPNRVYFSNNGNPSPSISTSTKFEDLQSSSPATIKYLFSLVQQHYNRKTDTFIHGIHTSFYKRHSICNINAYITISFILRTSLLDTSYSSYCTQLTNYPFQESWQANKYHYQFSLFPD